MDKANGYVIIRAANAGCFAGELESYEGDSVILRNARRLWYWDGAASLSQLAVNGTTKSASCKFPVAVPRAQIFGVIEILETTEKARNSIESVPEWKA